MGETTLTLYATSAILAFIPVFLWISIIFTKTKSKKLQTFIFFTGVFSVVPILLLQYLLQIFPQFDIANFLQHQIADKNINILVAFIGVGIIEEIFKQAIIRWLDKKYQLIQTINESIRFSLISALGFSFAENIFYIYHIWTHFGFQELFVAYTFRSVFTTCAHLVFSGFFGYFYGLAKFSLKITEHSHWIGKKLHLSNFLAKTLNITKPEAYKQILIVKGLLLATVLHAGFNFMLQLNFIIPVIIYISASAFYLWKLLQQKVGHLILITDAAHERASTMAKTDEEVVIELLGMWFTDKRYVDVIHICERLLQRDPDNKVVQLFKAKALDKMEENNVYSKILNYMFPQRNSIKSLRELEAEKRKNQTQQNTAKATSS